MQRISSKLEFPGEPIGNGGFHGQLMPIQTMKIIVTQYSFVESFRACGRDSHFTNSALYALFEYLERIEEDTDTELELDPVALCCEWAEYSNPAAAAAAFGYREGVDSKDETPLEWLQNRTDVIQFWENGVIIRNF